MAERACETDLHLTVRRAEDDEERRTREHPKEGDAALSSRMSGYEGVSAVRRDAVLADRTVEAFSSDEPETGQEGHDADRRVPAGRPLVERFDIESYSDFSAKSSNFRGLVLRCIKADFCDQILIFQHFARSRRYAILCTAQISKFQQKGGKNNSCFFNLVTFCKKSPFFHNGSVKFQICMYLFLMKSSRSAASRLCRHSVQTRLSFNASVLSCQSCVSFFPLSAASCKFHCSSMLRELHI